MQYRAALLSVLLFTSLVGAAAAPAAGQQASGEAYSGAHVQFDGGSNAVTDYAVDGNVIVENVTMQSSSEVRGQAGVGIDAGLSATTNINGASIDSQTKVSASVSLGFESGGNMTAYDTTRGVVQFNAAEGDQVVNAKLSSNAQAESEGDKRVVVTKEDGSQGAFIVVGDGEVVVNEQGNVTAEVKEGSQLVYRQYNDERSQKEEEAERMIQNGTATAEVYVQQAQDDGEDAADEGNETAVETIEYGQDTTVEVTSRSKNNVEMAVERSQSQGKVVLTTVSKEAFENAENIQVFVDGSAAVQVDSYSAVEQSAMQGDQPRYYVSQSSSAEAAVDIAVGIDHFSTRNVQMTSTQDATPTPTPTATDSMDESTATTTDSTDESTATATDSTSGDGAGFGVLAALSALASALFVRRRR
ncbi:MAG: co-chaperonin GroES (HSP10) [Natronomonas sp.]|jgi:co-chaperonin GroES (HSP10)|uniref:PGF-CTERM sorting domain-containing protein n=1 Tax=Natronomonas sp. TaxID=2184060 RepID=UPI0039897C0E